MDTADLLLELLPPADGDIEHKAFGDPHRHTARTAAMNVGMPYIAENRHRTGIQPTLYAVPLRLIRHYTFLPMVRDIVR